MTIMKTRSSRRLGFTLIELMIVIAIVAILAAILTPSFLKARAQSQLTACKSNVKNIGTACEMFAIDRKGRYPEQIAFLTLGAHGGYLKSIPSCPAAGSDTYSASYTFTKNPDCFTVRCGGANHVALNIPAGYPLYDSIVGLACAGEPGDEVVATGNGGNDSQASAAQQKAAEEAAAQQKAAEEAAAQQKAAEEAAAQQKAAEEAAAQQKAAEEAAQKAAAELAAQKAAEEAAAQQKAAEEAAAKQAKIDTGKGMVQAVSKKWEAMMDDIENTSLMDYLSRSSKQAKAREFKNGVYSVVKEAIASAGYENIKMMSDSSGRTKVYAEDGSVCAKLDANNDTFTITMNDDIWGALGSNPNAFTELLAL